MEREGQGVEGMGREERILINLVIYATILIYVNYLRGSTPDPYP